MTPSPADLFRIHPAPEAFARAVRDLAGELPFDTEAMLDLGRAYFERHHDSAGDRDLDAVRIGYTVVRVCAVEVALRGLASEGRSFFRGVFEQPSQTRALVEARIAAGEKPADLRAELAAVQAALDSIRAAIEAIPKGMIKERFVGGVSLLANGLYLARTWIARIGANPSEA